MLKTCLFSSSDAHVGSGAGSRFGVGDVSMCVACRGTHLGRRARKLVQKHKKRKIAQDYNKHTAVVVCRVLKAASRYHVLFPIFSTFSFSWKHKVMQDINNQNGAALAILGCLKSYAATPKHKGSMKIALLCQRFKHVDSGTEIRNYPPLRTANGADLESKKS